MAGSPEELGRGTSGGRRARLGEVIDDAGRDGPMARISTPTPEEHGQRRGDYPIEVAIRPGGERRIVARMENHGEWLEWVVWEDGPARSGLPAASPLP